MTALIIILLVILLPVVYNLLFPLKPPRLDNYFSPGQTFSSKWEGVVQKILKQTGDKVYSQVTLAPGAAGPPEHLHLGFNESGTITKGTLTVKLNNEVTEFSAGGRVKFLKGEYHTFSNQSSEEVIVTCDHEEDFVPVTAKREITFRDLLTHTSGLDYADIGTSKGKSIYKKNNIPSGLGYFDASLLERMKALGKLPLMFQPGEKFQYGLNTDLLGCLVEVISGMILEDFFTKNIFVPLGMNDTYFNLPASKASRLATVYTEDSLHHVIKWSHTFRNIDPDYPLMKKHYFSGGAGLSSTAYDYAIFMQMFLNGGIYNGHRILSKRSVEMMTSGQLAPDIFPPDNFGLGFAITSERSEAKGPRYAGSFSWGGYYGTTYWADPKAHLVCLFMTQQTPNSHSDVERKFEALVYSSLK